jgi:hypothetical protein
MKYSAVALLQAGIVSAQTLYLAGDSTMAAGDGTIQGEFISKLIKL